MQINSPGKYNITMKEYHLDPCPEPSLSRSSIQDLLFHSPAHCAFNHPRLNPNFQEDNDKKFDLGTATHAILLEDSENICVINAEDWRKKETKEAREEAIKEGKTALLQHQYEQALKMAAEAGDCIGKCKELQISNLRKDGDAELSYIWKEDNTWFRSRPDWISQDRKLIIDYKSTEASANPSDYMRIALSTGLDIQSSLYTRGVKAIEGGNPRFVLVVQEAYEPFLCSFISFTPQFMEMGKQKCDYGIFLWNQCMEIGKWPGYPSKICWLEPPAWSLSSWEQRASEIGMGGE